MGALYYYYLAKAVSSRNSGSQGGSHSRSGLHNGRSTDYDNERENYLCWKLRRRRYLDGVSSKIEGLDIVDVVEAIENGYFKVLNLIIDAGQASEIADCLSYVIMSDRVDVLKFLIDNNIEIKKFCKFGDREINYLLPPPFGEIFKEECKTVKDIHIFTLAVLSRADNIAKFLIDNKMISVEYAQKIIDNFNNASKMKIGKYVKKKVKKLKMAKLLKKINIFRFIKQSKTKNKEEDKSF